MKNYYSFQIISGLVWFYSQIKNETNLVWNFYCGHMEYLNIYWFTNTKEENQEIENAGLKISKTAYHKWF